MILGKHTGLFAVIILCFLSVTDLIYPSKGDEVNRIVPQIGRALFFVVMVMTVFHINLKNGITKLSSVGKSVLYLFLMVTAFFLLNAENFGEELMDFVKIIYWMIGFFYIRNLVKNELISQRQIEVLVITLVIVYFLIVLRDSSNQALMWGSRFYAVSNNGYNLLRFFPFVLLLPNKTLKNILIGIIALGAVLSFKRGVIVAFAIGFSVYYFRIIINSKRRKLIDLIVGALAIGVAVYFVQGNMEVIEHRMQDFSDVKTAGSGRGNMYSLILDDVFGNNIEVVKLLFGNGIYATKQFFGETIHHFIVAHSDVLEILYDFGLLGIFLVIYFFRSIYKLYIRYKKTIEGDALLIWIITIGLSSIYSVNLFSPEMIYSILIIAYLDAKKPVIKMKEL
jgi:hypothetical protein